VFEKDIYAKNIYILNTKNSTKILQQIILVLFIIYYYLSAFA